MMEVQHTAAELRRYSQKQCRLLALKEYQARFPLASTRQLRVTLDMYLQNQIRNRLSSAESVQECKLKALTRHRCHASRCLEGLNELLTDPKNVDAAACLIITQAVELIRLSHVLIDTNTPAERIVELLEALRDVPYLSEFIGMTIRDSADRIRGVDLHVNAHMVCEVIHVDIPGLMALKTHLGVAMAPSLMVKIEALESAYSYNSDFYDYLWSSYYV